MNTSIRLVFLDLLTFRVNSFCLELNSLTETSLVMGIEMKGMYEKMTIINRQPSQKIKHVHPRNYTPTNNSKTPNPRKLALKNSNDSTVGKVAA